jgi:hypothetical protein
MADWIPAALLAFIALIKRWDIWLSDPAKIAAFGWDQATCVRIVLEIGEFLAALEVYELDKTHEKCDAMNKKMKVLKTSMRGFANSSIRYNDKMTEEDKLYLGIRPRDMIPTTDPKPSLRPETDALPTGRRQHTVTAIDPETKNKKKPPFVKGVAFAHRLRLPGEPKAKAEEMPSVFKKKTVLDFLWEEADVGKVADYATAYENEDTDRGPWSDVVSLTVA